MKQKTMSNSIYKQTREGFAGTTDTRASDVNSFFANTLPNPILVTDRNLNIASLTTDQLAGTTRITPVLQNVQLQTGQSSQLLAQRQAQCESSGSVDKFQHLTNLANSQNPTSPARCGWIYNTQNPQRGAGAFGTSSGPYQAPIQGQWMWDLQAAKKKVHVNLCQSVQTCGDISSPMYKGRCGFCKSSGKPIPITDGRVAYPFDPNLSCGADGLVTVGTSCPPLPTASSGTPGTPGYVPTDICASLPNGALKRDCIIQKATQAGCETTGTLIQALNNGSDSNYLDALVQAKAYSVYQQRAVIPLDETSLKTGKIAVADALTEFKRVNDQATSSVQTGLRASARDLCFQSGEVDKYDFCSEISDTTPPPFSLECLQKVFLKAGGQSSGALFPVATNIAREWNSQSSWSSVKAKIKVLSDGTNSTDRAKQQTAMLNFLGIPLEDKSKPLMPKMAGVEIFWFTHQWDVNTPTIFLGRRIRPTIPMINQSMDLKGTQGQGNRTDMTSFNYITNLLPPADTSIRIRVTGDDGYATKLNSPMTSLWTWKWAVSGNELTWLGYFPPQTTWNWWSCWGLTSKGPNILHGYWFNGGGGFFYSLEYQANCAANWWTNWSSGWGQVPSSMCHLTKEPFAPMIEFESYGNYSDYGAPISFCDKRLSGNKLQWNFTGGKPTMVQAPATPTTEFPFAKSYQQFVTNTGIMSKYGMKLASFLTMTMLIQFDAMPNNAANIPNFTYFYNAARNQYVLLELMGTGDYNTAKMRLNFQSRTRGFSKIVEGPTLTAGVKYLITLRMLRGNDTDIFSLNGMQIGAAPLSDLQKDGSKLQESAILAPTWPSGVFDKTVFDDPNDGGSYAQHIGYAGMRVYWTHFFDYNMDAAAIKREANQDWLSTWYS
jgi:hypothetical protein